MGIGCKPWRMGRTHVRVKSLASHDFFEVVEVEAFNASLKESLALCELPLNRLSMPARGKCLAVSVLLVTSCSRGCTRSASWMF